MDKLALQGFAISHDHEYYRLITGGFLHAGFLHIAFNMYLLYVLGQLLEPSLGHVRFGILYFVSLLAARSAPWWRPARSSRPSARRARCSA